MKCVAYGLPDRGPSIVDGHEKVYSRVWDTKSNWARHSLLFDTLNHLEVPIRNIIDENWGVASYVADRIVAVLA